jgi:hypothetical protein
VWDTIVDFANDFWSENSTAIVSTVLVLIGAFILTAIARHGVKQWDR